MSDTPFLGELRLLSCNFAPRGWAQCDGQLLPINQNQPLFSLFGTSYGGDGRATFALPDMRGRTPVHRGGELELVEGQAIGEEFHTVTPSELPAHNHTVLASTTAGNQPNPGMLAATNNAYRSAGDLTALHPNTLAAVGGSQAHENRQPSLVLCWCVALIGIFPSRN